MEKNISTRRVVRIRQRDMETNRYHDSVRAIVSVSKMNMLLSIEDLSIYFIHNKIKQTILVYIGQTD
jgi:hypothetical protein